MKMDRIEYYMTIARETAKRSKCSRRKFGAILVKNDEIVSTGYNGSARGTLNCGLDIPCLKDLYREDHYSSYKYCPALHAEDNAVSRVGWEKSNGCIMFLAPADDKDGDMPCHSCREKLIQGGVSGVWYIGRDETLKYISNTGLLTMENEWMMDTLKTGNPDYVEEVLKDE